MLQDKTSKTVLSGAFYKWWMGAGEVNLKMEHIIANSLMSDNTTGIRKTEDNLPALIFSE